MGLNFKSFAFGVGFVVAGLALWSLGMMGYAKMQEKAPADTTAKV